MSIRDVVRLRNGAWGKHSIDSPAKVNAPTVLSQFRGAVPQLTLFKTRFMRTQPTRRAHARLTMDNGSDEYGQSKHEPRSTADSGLYHAADRLRRIEQ